MYKILLFVHLASLTVWVGAMVMQTLWLRESLKKEELFNWTMESIQKKGNRILHPASFLLLASGIWMILMGGWHDNGLPLWIRIMEDLGGLVIVFAWFVPALYGRKILKKIKAGNTSQAQLTTMAKRYMQIIGIIVLLVMVIILMVALKLS